jgi:hypothetical protein
MKKTKKSFPVKPALLLAASAILLIGSTVGSTRAALTYYSENYSAQVNMYSIGVTLLENGTAVSHRNYTDNGSWDETKDGKLLSSLQSQRIIPGKLYDEALTVQNTGSIDSFVRVVLKRSWKDGKGTKDTTLSPDLIDLKINTSNGWVEDTANSTDERIVLYYTKALAAGATSPALSDSIRIDNQIVNKVNKIQNGNTISYEYVYNGYSFNLEAEVDAVQTHNAQEAIKSAWGVDVNVSSDETSLGL